MLKPLCIPSFLMASLVSIHSFAEDITLNNANMEQSRRLEILESEIEELKLIISQSGPTLNKQTSKNWAFVSYGSLLYKNDEKFENIQDAEPERRAITDLERVVTELSYRANAQWQVETEIEYEHGGTGTALEYDGFDEFGEFESEVEAGGEIVIEKAEIKYSANKKIGVKFGHITVPVGLGSDLDKPAQYFSTQRHWSEAALIPQVWHETGVNVFGQVADFQYQALLTTGLNSEFFRTSSWVAGGRQRQFEFVNADDLALTLRLDYGSVRKDNGIGLSYYTGETSGNRHNSGKIKESGTVSIIGIHAAKNVGNATLRGQYLIGNLDDTDAISAANKSTPGLNAGSLTTLGSEAESWFIEAGYNVSTILQTKNTLTLFLALEHANPLKALENGSPSKRNDNTETSIGMNYFPIRNIVLKTQLGNMTHARPNLPDTTAFSLSVGYQFSL